MELTPSHSHLLSTFVTRNSEADNFVIFMWPFDLLFRFQIFSFNQHNDVTIISYCFHENICAVDYPDIVFTIKHTIFSLIRPERKNVKHNSFPKGKIAYFRSTIYWDVIIFFYLKKHLEYRLELQFIVPASAAMNVNCEKSARNFIEKVTK